MISFSINIPFHLFEITQVKTKKFIAEHQNFSSLIFCVLLVENENIAKEGSKEKSERQNDNGRICLEFMTLKYHCLMD